MDNMYWIVGMFRFVAVCCCTPKPIHINSRLDWLDGSGVPGALRHSASGADSWIGRQAPTALDAPSNPLVQ